MKRIMKKYYIFSVLVILIIAGCSGNLNNGLVAYYPFDGNANDKSGNGNHGTEFGGVSYVKSDRGKALMLDGNSGYIRVTNPEQEFSTEFTVSVWVSTENHWGQILSKYSWNGVSDGISLTVTSESGGGGVASDGTTLFGFVFDSQAYNPSLHPSFTIAPNQMTKIAFVYENGMSSLYVNDELKESKMITGINSLTNVYDILIGSYFSTNGTIVTIDSQSKGYKGLIDDLRIYNRALSQEELKIFP